MSRRCSTPEADASPDALRRFMYPEEYPCYNLAGEYMPTSGCRERCCVLPPGTPEGDDSPKWTHTLAVRQAELESASPLAQPDFNSPKKIFTYDKSSGITPPDVRGKERGRVQAVLGLGAPSKGWEDAHPGIPGKNEDTAIDVEEYA